MPELPEVESTRAIIEKNCLNQTIVRAETKELGGGPREGIFDDLVYENDINATGDKEKLFLAAILKKKLTAVKRRGKYFWFELEKSNVVTMFHFGMTGSMIFKDLESLQYKSFKRKNDEWPPKFTKLLLEFSNGLQLAFSDARRLGRIKLRTNHLSVPPLSALGLDPVLDPLPSTSELVSIFSKIAAPIKAVLLDQEKVFCGLGNWMIDEILYQSGIHPASPAQSLNAACVSKILDSMQYIISTAIDCNNAFQPFPKHWLYHYRWDKGKAGKSSDQEQQPVNRMPDGSVISHDTQGGRTSAVVLSKQVKYTVNGGQRQKKAEKEDDENVSDEATAAGKVVGSGVKQKKTTATEKKSAGGRKRKAAAEAIPETGSGRRSSRSSSGRGVSEVVEEKTAKKTKSAAGPARKRRNSAENDEVTASAPAKRRRGSAK